MESVKRLFPKFLPTNKWDSSSATYGPRSSAYFVAFVDDLLKAYKQIFSLSPELDEFKKVYYNANDLGKKEFLEKKSHNSVVNTTKPTYTRTNTWKKVSPVVVSKSIEEIVVTESATGVTVEDTKVTQTGDDVKVTKETTTYEKDKRPKRVVKSSKKSNTDDGWTKVK